MRCIFNSIVLLSIAYQVYIGKMSKELHIKPSSTSSTKSCGKVPCFTFPIMFDHSG